MLAKGTTQDDVRERLKQHLRAAAGHEDMDEQEVELVAGLAETAEWEEDEPTKPSPTRIPPPAPPAANALTRSRANVELASVVSDAVAAGIQAPLFRETYLFL